jgi:hypothetical protein
VYSCQHCRHRYLVPPLVVYIAVLLPKMAVRRGASVAGDFDAARGHCAVARVRARATVPTGFNPRKR